MRTIPRLAGLLCMTGAMCFAATWRGASLLDARCYDQHGKVSHVARMCAPTASTTNFAMESESGKIYKLDSQSNRMAEQAFENSVIQPDRHGVYHATVTGEREQGSFVAVSSIQHGSKSVY